MIVQLLTYLALILVVLFPVVLWRLKFIPFNFGAFGAAIIGAMLTVFVFTLQGSTEMPEASAPFVSKFLAMVAISCMAVSFVRLARALAIEFLITRRANSKLPHFVLDLMSWVLLAFIIVSVLRLVFQVEVNGLLVGSTVLSAVIGLSLQGVLGNLIAGVILQAEYPFETGDWLLIEGVEGRVRYQNWRTVTLQTIENNLVTVTNSKASDTIMLNYSRPSKEHTLVAEVGVHYTHPPADVIRVLEQAAVGVEGVVQKPKSTHGHKPYATLMSFGNSSINYRLFYMITDHAQHLRISSAVNQRIWYGLKRANMEIPFPIVSLYDKAWVDGQHQQSVMAEQHRIHTLLPSFSLVEFMNDDQIGEFTKASKLATYLAGEPLVTQGDAGDSLFLVVSGVVGVYINQEKGSPIRIDQRITGEFFGEGSLLTGTPRSASVIAETAVEAIIIDKEPFVELISNEHEILNLLLDALDKRSENLVKSHEDTPVAQDTDNARSDFLQRMTSFLGINFLNRK